ncbi:MAG: TolC family protein [Acidimicrobiia bacterium]|nr:TolC family protein [Acidimicrobiia bacterium]
MNRLPIAAAPGSAPQSFCTGMAAPLVILIALAASPAAGQARTPGVRPPLANRTLTLDEAIQMGVEHNLSVINGREGVRFAQGQRRTSRAPLLPSAFLDVTDTQQQLNLAAMGFRFDMSAFPGFQLPSVVGPFNQFDLRARFSHTVFDRAAINSYRAAGESLRASELSADDERDAVILAVGAAYLQAMAARALVDSGRTQLDTANALLKQTQQRRAVGLVAQVDVDRSQVQVLQQEQRLIALQNDFAKLKIDLARLIGAQPTDQYALEDALPFTAGPPLDVDAALEQARAQRPDLRAADAEVRAAEQELNAARAAHLPTVRLNGDYGVLGPNPADARRTFAVSGTVRVPLWQGGRVEGQIQQAQAQLARRQTAHDDLHAQVEAEIRKALLDMSSLAAQVAVAERNLAVTRETLDLTRQRFEAGVSDNVEVVQAQESVSTAAFDHINSVFGHSVARLSLARALGNTRERLRSFLGP